VEEAEEGGEMEVMKAKYEAVMAKYEAVMAKYEAVMAEFAEFKKMTVEKKAEEAAEVEAVTERK